MGKIRTFKTGATRDTDENKLEPWGFTSALVEKAFSEYMQDHRTQSDGGLRDSNNWNPRHSTRVVLSFSFKTHSGLASTLGTLP